MRILQIGLVVVAGLLGDYFFCDLTHSSLESVIVAPFVVIKFFNIDYGPFLRHESGMSI